MSRIVLLDIGGTSVKNGSVDIDGTNFTPSENVSTDVKGGMSAIKNAVKLAVNNNLQEAKAIAVSSAGDINPYTGNCFYATDNLWGEKGFDVRGFLEKEFSFETFVIGDGQAALLGEMAFGAGRGKNDVAMLTFGTGIGGAFYRDGIVFGKDFRYAKFGHETLYPTGRQCNCGKRGCVEQYISATALMREVKEKKLYASNSEELFTLSETNAEAKEIVDKFISDVSETVKMIAFKYGAKNFVFGGGLTYLGKYWVDEVRKACSLYVKIAVAELGNNAGMLGAYQWYRQSKNLQE